MRFIDFYEKFMRFGLERFGFYYGTYRAVVVSTEDPEDRGRIKVRVIRASGRAELNVWVDPTQLGAGSNRGTFWPPEKGDSVTVKFDNGDKSKPIFYSGGWYGTGDLPPEFSYSNGRPERRGMITRMGHGIIFIDEPGSERVRLLWHRPGEGDAALSDPSISADRNSGDNAFLSFESDGSIQMSNSRGSNINIKASSDSEKGSFTIIDENSNSVTLDSTGIKLISGSGNSACLTSNSFEVIASSKVKLAAPSVELIGGGVFMTQTPNNSVPLGEPLIGWLNSHSHGTGVGPSTPPLVPATPALLSQKVKLS